ncbi:MAG: thiamine pyrophosphate-dependent dehydrogenase E1 component subunit alpha [Candidatus Omnitrophota bacterium]
MPIIRNQDILDPYQKSNKEILKWFLATMIKIRRFEESVARIYPEQGMKCPVHLCVGQEAVPSGLCKNLRDADVFFGSHRSHGYYIASGGDIKALIAELYGKFSGCTKGKGGSQHLACPEKGFLGSSAIVAGTIPIAVGAALSFAMQDKKNVSVVDFGDGAVDEGVFYESLNFSAIRKLPVIFICENNLYATHARQSVRQAEDNIFRKAKLFGVCGIRIDGNNVFEVFTSCRDAIRRARAGKGPTLIECRTYRWLEHVGPDYDYNLGYRTKKELKIWMKKCPIERLERLLTKRSLVTKSEVAGMYRDIDFEIEEAVTFAKKSVFPKDDELLRDVYFS